MLCEKFSDRKMFKIKEVAEILGVSTKSIRRLIASGALVSNRHLRHHLIPADSVTAFVNGGVSHGK